jgi:hypothetical protein
MEFSKPETELSNASTRNPNFTWRYSKIPISKNVKHENNKEARIKNLSFLDKDVIIGKLFNSGFLLLLKNFFF